MVKWTWLTNSRAGAVCYSHDLLAGVILSDNNAAQICSYQLPVSMHDSDNANEVSGKWGA